MSFIRAGILKRIFFDRIFQRSYWTWRKRPAIIVPTMLGSGLSAIGQSILTLTAILLATDFALRNTLFDFLASSSSRGVLQTVLSPQYFMSIIPATIVAGFILGMALVLGGGFILSSEYGTYFEAWQSDKATFRSIIDNGSRRWKQMAWTFLLRETITWGPFVAGLILLLLSLPSIGTPQGLAAFLGAYYALIFGIGASFVLALFTLYSYPAVVVDQLSGFRAIRHSFRVTSQHLGVTLTYGVVRVMFQLLLTLVAFFATDVGLPLTSLATVVLSLCLIPVLHSTKTMIYYHASPSIPEMPFAVGEPIWMDIGRRLPRAAWGRVRMGLSELGRFVIGPRNLPFHAMSILAFWGGILWGEFVSGRGIRRFILDVLGYEPGRLSPLLDQTFRPVLGVDLFFHNWLVSIHAAMAGIGFAVPAFEVVLFNGFAIGIWGTLIPTPTMALAWILPHGVIEMPALLVAGSVGIKLGYAASRAKASPGLAGSDYLCATLRQAVYIVIGLAPMFLVAGLIEANVSPVIAGMFGWT